MSPFDDKNNGQQRFESQPTQNDATIEGITRNPVNSQLPESSKDSTGKGVTQTKDSQEDLYVKKQINNLPNAELLIKQVCREKHVNPDKELDKIQQKEHEDRVEKLKTFIKESDVDTKNQLLEVCSQQLKKKYMSQDGKEIPLNDHVKDFIYSLFNYDNFKNIPKEKFIDHLKKSEVAPKKKTMFFSITKFLSKNNNEGLWASLVKLNDDIAQEKERELNPSSNSKHRIN